MFHPNLDHSQNLFLDRLADKQVCFTFDDGPGDAVHGSTLAIARFLSEHDISATFFVVGQRIVRRGGREALVQLRDMGHLIANHTFNHPRLTRLLAENPAAIAGEFIETHDLIREFVSPGEFLFRPPFGDWNKAVADAVNALPGFEQYYGPIGWNMHCHDWDLGRQVNGAVWTVDCAKPFLADHLAKLRRGVILLHDSVPDINHTVAIHKRDRDEFELIQWLVGKLETDGFGFVGLNELVRGK